MAVKVKSFYQPSYSANDWEARNPILKLGQIGIELDDNGSPAKMKVGNGVISWRFLPYFNPAIYNYDDPVTNPIGDLENGEILEGDTLESIINKMVSPYEPPTALQASNNAGSLAEFKEVTDV